MAVYLLYKLLRHDFAYGLDSGQHSESLLSVFWFSLLLRVCSKIITDFIGNVHMRHPYELGGVYWCWTLLSMPFFCYFFGLKYLAFMQSDEGKARRYDMVLEPRHLCTMVSEATIGRSRRRGDNIIYLELNANNICSPRADRQPISLARSHVPLRPEEFQA